MALFSTLWRNMVKAIEPELVRNHGRAGLYVVFIDTKPFHPPAIPGRSHEGR